jgi:hypothetical protein
VSHMSLNTHCQRLQARAPYLDASVSIRAPSIRAP